MIIFFNSLFLFLTRKNKNDIKPINMPELGIIFHSKILLNQSESEILSCNDPKYQRIEFLKLKPPITG